MSYRWMLACGVALALGAGGARADTLTVCSEGSPDFLNAVLSNSNTSFDVSEQIGDRLVEMEIGTSKGDPRAGGILDDFRRRRCAAPSSCGTGVKFQSSA